MAVDDAIEQILYDIPRSKLFDSHFVIRQLIRYYSDDYIRFVAEYATGGNPTLTAHQMIGHRIKQFNNRLVERLDDQGWSENIYGSPSECAIWRKV